LTRRAKLLANTQVGFYNLIKVNFQNSWITLNPLLKKSDFI
jgi:hypothetical protein